MQNSPKTMDETVKGKAKGSDQKPVRRCLFCGQQAELIWVHGHGQCAACGINAEECCRGETCDGE